LLGDLGLNQLDAFVALAPFYGGAAVLIRETVRRSGRGWTSFVLLALAYALFEEGIVTQSLFNPNYLHLRLLDYGYVAALGTAIPWAIYVLGIHIAWSLAVPIGLAEASFSDRRTEPWLNKVGLVVVGLLFVAGATLVANFSRSDTPYRDSPAQLLVSAVLILILIAAALFGPRAVARETEAPATNPWLIGAACLTGGSAFLAAYALGTGEFAWPATTAIEATVAAAILAFFAWAAARRWTALQTWAAAAGGMLCYAWFGYFIDRDMHPPSGTPTHSVFVVIVVVIAIWAGIRTRRAAGAPSPHPAPVA